jgi:Tfp pilus assembly protein PilX
MSAHVRRSRRIHRTRAARSGAALPVVLLIVSMMLLTSAASFEAALLEARNANAVADHLQSFHAADAALVLCSRALANGTLDAPAAAALPGEPQAWRRPDGFEREAVAPVPAWPGSTRAPQCLVEAWRIDSRPLARAYLVTARGFGVSEDTQSWLQDQLVIEGSGDAMHVEHHWRHVVARPF